MANRKQRRITEAHTKKETRISLNGAEHSVDDAFAFALKEHNAGNHAEASRIYRLIIAKEPQHIRSLNNLGQLRFLADELDEAVELYRRALRCKPDYIYGLYNLGEAFVTKGEKKSAEEMFRKILSLKPSHAKSLYHLAHLHKHETIDAPNVRYIQTLAGDAGAVAENKEYLYFALGKIFDECGEYDQAFGYYQQGNNILAARTGYIPGRATEEYDAISASFSKEFMSRSFPFSSDSEQPLFIIGMPRSGTTLLANILSNHPAIAAKGELQTMPEMALTPIEAGGAIIPFPWSAHHITPDIAVDYIAHYQKRLMRDVNSKKIYVIDKHPINFQYLGVIAMLFPKARVIHCTRDPMDTCLSNYFQYFDISYAYCFDLKRIGHFYRGYVNLMEHWKQVLPFPVLDIRYEDTVGHMEETIRKILDFLGLEWDERCLSPHTNARPVKTASMWQVRQPVYTRSVERWRHYEKHLAPLKEALGDLV